MTETSPQALIGSDLQEVEDIIRASGESAAEPLASIFRGLWDAGGKRIRPTVTLLMGRLMEAPREPLIRLAAAVEITHTATLIHDDLLDHAEMRRGQSALHVRHSSGIAVLAGDYLFSQAACLAAATGYLPVMERFAAMLATIVRGEVEQMGGRRMIPSVAEYESRIYSKTAAMFETVCASAALIAQFAHPSEESGAYSDPLTFSNQKAEVRLTGPSGETVATAGRFGRCLGMAFQVTDDVLDFSSEEDTIGKPARHDLNQGILTLPVLLFRATHPHDPDLEAICAGHFEAADTRRLANAIRSSDCLRTARAKAEEYGNMAAQCLAAFATSPFRSALEELARQASARIS